MNVGSLIKYYRTKQGMTQSELVEGICSVPHLSKIENNGKEGNDQTIDLLLKRLGANLMEAGPPPYPRMPGIKNAINICQ